MSSLLWIGFIAFIGLMLAFDAGLLHKKAKLVPTHKAIVWTLVCCALALGFSVFVYFAYEYGWLGISGGRHGSQAAAEYVTAWLLEQSLSLDNVFVFALIFSYFRVPRQYQHRVLLWGILGALILRGIMIGAGAALLAHFDFIKYFFGAALLYAAFKMLRADAENFDPQRNLLFRAVKRLFPLHHEIVGEHFFVRIADGRRLMTPLFLVLVVVESSDLLFAFDSIPAVFGITRDPFLVFTSNIFAILNLRSLFFVLSALMAKFERLTLALVLVLVFIAAKMLLEDVVHISTPISLATVSGLLLLGVIASVIENIVARKGSSG